QGLGRRIVEMVLAIAHPVYRGTEIRVAAEPMLHEVVMTERRQAAERHDDHDRSVAGGDAVFISDEHRRPAAIEPEIQTPGGVLDDCGEACRTRLVIG